MADDIRFHERLLRLSDWIDGDTNIDVDLWPIPKQALEEIERLRAVVDALTARPFRGTSSERRERMYGSDWEPVHDALDALEARRG